MPLYEYRCSSCGHQQEFLQKWSDAPMTVCTACGKETFSKMLTAAGFQLKGSGWYATDFKNSGAKQGKAKTESKDSDSGKSEAKPETKNPETKNPDTKKPDTKSEAVSCGAGACPSC